MCYRMHVCGSLIYIYILQSNPLIHRQFCVGGGVACKRIDGVPCNFTPISNRIWNAIFFDSSVSSAHSITHISANAYAYAYRRLNWFALCLFDFAHSFAVAHWHNFLSSICAVEQPRYVLGATNETDEMKRNTLEMAPIFDSKLKQRTKTQMLSLYGWTNPNWNCCLYLF